MTRVQVSSEPTAQALERGIRDVGIALRLLRRRRTRLARLLAAIAAAEKARTGEVFLDKPSADAAPCSHARTARRDVCPTLSPSSTTVSESGSGSVNTSRDGAIPSALARRSCVSRVGLV